MEQCHNTEIGNEINSTVPYFFHRSIDYESFKAQTSLLIYLGWNVHFVCVDCFNHTEWMWYTHAHLSTKSDQVSANTFTLTFTLTYTSTRIDRESAFVTARYVFCDR